MLPSIQSDADFLLLSRRSLTLALPLLFLLAGAHPSVPSLSRRPCRSPTASPYDRRPSAAPCIASSSRPCLPPSTALNSRYHPASRAACRCRCTTANVLTPCRRKCPPGTGTSTGTGNDDPTNQRPAAMALGGIAVRFCIIARQNASTWS